MSAGFPSALEVANVRVKRVGWNLEIRPWTGLQKQIVRARGGRC